MAVLSKNGHELARVNELTRSFSFRSNGYILVNHGDGWNRWNNGPFEDIDERAKNAVWFEAELGKGYQAFKQLLHDLIAMRNRALAYAMIKQHRSDPDALFSEFDDYGWGVTHADAKQLVEYHAQFRASLDDEPFSVEVLFPGRAIYTMVGVVSGDLEFRKREGNRMVDLAIGREVNEPAVIKSIKRQRCVTTPRVVRAAVMVGRGTFEVVRQHPEYDRLSKEGLEP